MEPIKDLSSIRILYLFGILGLLQLPSSVNSNPTVENLHNHRLTSATSKPHPSDHPWIGSHKLEFSPNPFLRDSKGRLSDKHRAASSASNEQIEATDSLQTFSEYKVASHDKSAAIPQKNRRKVKGRRRLPLHLRKQEEDVVKGKSKTFSDVISTAQSPTGEVLSSTPLSFGEKLFSHQTDRNEFDDANIEFIPITQVSIHPPVKYAHVNSSPHPFHLPLGQQTRTINKAFNIADQITLTTSMPQSSVTFPRDNTLGRTDIDYAAHPEKLNPSYFRNIILKTMMDKLVSVGIVTHAPTLIHTQKRES